VAKRTSSAGAAAGATPADGSLRESAKSCPSGPCRDEALLLGVMTEAGTLAYVQPPTRVNAEFVARAKALGRPESRFRFSVPCIEAGCPQWTGKGCAVIEKVLEEESSESTQAAALPRCAIRPTCRWYFQRGAAACAVCPLVVADIGGKETYRSTLASQARD
jgi:hypothetical protein